MVLSILLLINAYITSSFTCTKSKTTVLLVADVLSRTVLLAQVRQIAIHASQDTHWRVLCRVVPTRIAVNAWVGCLVVYAMLVTCLTRARSSAWLVVPRISTWIPWRKHATIVERIARLAMQLSALHVPRGIKSIPVMHIPALLARFLTAIPVIQVVITYIHTHTEIKRNEKINIYSYKIIFCFMNEFIFLIHYN